MPSQTTTSQCRDIQTLLPWYCNGTLESQEQSHVKAHLIQCPSCRGEMRQTRELMGIVGTLQLYEARREAACRPLRPEVSTAPRPRSRPEASPRPSGYLRLAAAVLLFLGIGYVAGISQSTNSNLPGETPARLAASISGGPSEAQVLMVDSFESGSSANWFVQIGEGDAARLDSIRQGDG